MHPDQVADKLRAEPSPRVLAPMPSPEGSDCGARSNTRCGSSQPIRHRLVGRARQGGLHNREREKCIFQCIVNTDSEQW